MVWVTAQSLKELSGTDEGGHMSDHTLYNLTLKYFQSYPSLDYPEPDIIALFSSL